MLDVVMLAIGLRAWTKLLARCPVHHLSLGQAFQLNGKMKFGSRCEAPDRFDRCC